ncbi:MAG: hypothetical protein KIT89_00150 [Microcella sp.]|uniref:sensor histidine kinase n=1 Tax=Microcella sp. TaxID=1913979 RepID=UPI0024C5EF80|nr:ATP-binding protein [Microcella sp.]UYN83701.1 MAG: hypothetical protein KIT89_00150 [Microcella sp.]
MIDVGLPRAVASAVLVQSLAFAQRIMAIIGSVVAATIVVDVQLSRGAVETIPLIAAPFFGIGLLALLLVWRPTVPIALTFVLGGAILSIAVPVVGTALDPSFGDTGSYLLNRVATAICLVGAVGSSAVSGLVWSAAGFVVAQASVVAGLALAGSTAPVGSGPLIVFSISFIAYLTLMVGQRQADRRLRPIRAAEQEVRTLDDRGVLERRAAGVLHDTVLADLTAIAQQPGRLSERAQRVLAEHVDLIDSATVARARDEPAPLHALGESLRTLAREYQWSGVRVDVNGIEALRDAVAADVRHAVVGAVRAALDNVVHHAGTDRAELVVGMRDDRLTVLVVDDGLGFSADALPTDRLGVRASIVDRVEQVGGSVKVWSGPDGTTIMMTVPLDGGSP